jgi:AcrR family transcriptional regulator
MAARDTTKKAVVGRGSKVRTAVLAATIEELADRGYTDLTIENVARRAGVHKTTVYRRWDDRERLVVEALAEHVATEAPISECGSIEHDLRALALSLIELLEGRTGQAIIAVMLSDARRIPEIARIRDKMFRDRFERARPVVVRAIESGELPAETDPSEVIKTLIAPIYFRILVAGKPADIQTADHAVAVTLAAARAGVLHGIER